MVVSFKCSYIFLPEFSYIALCPYYVWVECLLFKWEQESLCESMSLKNRVVENPYFEYVKFLQMDDVFYMPAYEPLPFQIS